MNALAKHRVPVLLCLLLPGMAYLIAIRLLPALFTVGISFTHWNLREGGWPRPVGLQNYVALIGDTGFLAALGRTLLFMVLATAIEPVLGLAIALLLNGKVFLRRAVRTIVLAPMVLTPAVVGMIWYILFHPQIGPVNWVLSLAGIAGPGWLTSPATAPLAVLIADVWHWTPFMMLLCLAGLQGVPQELTEAAQVDGPGPWQTLWRINVMTGGGPGDSTDTLSLHIYKAAFTFFNMGYAGATVVVSVGILVVLYGAYLRLSPEPA